MKFIFFGSPEFAAIILEKMIKADLLPQAVVCNPDKPVGKKKIITAPPIKKLLIEKFKDLKIKIYQPEKILDVKSQLSDVDCQLFIVAAYAKIISKEILEIPSFPSTAVQRRFKPQF